MSAPITTGRLTAALADRYRIEREIGAGGMATVYVAEDVRHRRRVALKVLHAELSAVLGPERFLKEIELTANLQHPHILPLFDSGSADGLLFYVMPFVEGESLRARLDREKQLPIGDALQVAREVADALSYAHARSVVHRDIKPENILLQGGHALVADFGIALAVQQAGGARMTQTGLSLGTPQYMAPEQAMGEKTIDLRADIYALGAVTYEMLAGEPPFTGPTAQAIVARVLTSVPLPLTQTRATIPAHVDAAILTALAKLPADRFASAREYAEALSGHRLATAASTGSAVSPSASVPGKRRGRPGAREAIAWTLAVVGLTVSAWLATRRAPVNTPGRFYIQLPDSVSFAPFSNSTGRLAISRDGSQLAFVGRASNQPGTSALYIRRANDAVAERLRGTDGARSPAFSPSGEWIVYTTGPSLVRVPVTGGAPQTIATVADSTAIGYSSWGDDGRITFQSGAALWIVSADGGDTKLVARPDTTQRIFQLRQPDVLPGGSYALISFTRGSRTANAAPDSLRLGVLSLSEGSLVDLGVQGAEPHYVSPGYVVYNRGSIVFAAPFSLRSRSFTGPPARLLDDVTGVNPVTADFAVAQNGWLTYMAGGQGGVTSLWVVERDGRARQLKTDARLFRDAAISPDGNRIAVVVSPDGSPANADVWIYDIASGSLTPLTTGGASSVPAWTRDGRRVFYLAVASNRGRSLVSRTWDGSGAESTHVSEDRLSEFEPGPVGGYSAFRTSPPRDILLAPTESLQARRPFLTTPASEYYPRISPNGQLLAYQSDASGRNEVFVRPISGPGGAVPVSIDGGVQPRWSPDGRTVYFRSPSHLIAASIVERPQLAVSQRDTLFIDAAFARVLGFQFDVFPNARQFLMLKGGTATAQLVMIVNWPQLIGRSAVSAPER